MKTPEPPSYAQDPLYNDRDATVLKEHSIKIEEDPAATNAIDNTTFLYMPFLDRRAVFEGLNMGPGIVFANKIDPPISHPEEQKVLDAFRAEIKFERAVGPLLAPFSRPFREHYLYAT